VQSDQLHESTVTGQAKRQSEEEQEQLLDELIRRLRLTLASCESLAAVMRLRASRHLSIAPRIIPLGPADGEEEQNECAITRRL
jgi:hypothetical protein